MDFRIHHYTDLLIAVKDVNKSINSIIYAPIVTLMCPWLIIFGPNFRLEFYEQTECRHKSGQNQNLLKYLIENAENVSYEAAGQQILGSILYY